ncbi:hypothetical protein FF38_06695 [Lucilia cuprina]|uniref:Uncharacterized protein n=1 Tax=Lucilia cuprina TaxID=7375 RepID=A0A0L0C1E2_LUCCU|nr:hypothetical protein FF38_06695 [Lucilia cuprina]
MKRILGSHLMVDIHQNFKPILANKKSHNRYARLWFQKSDRIQVEILRNLENGLSKGLLEVSKETELPNIGRREEKDDIESYCKKDNSEEVLIVVEDSYLRLLRIDREINNIRRKRVSDSKKLLISANLVKPTAMVDKDVQSILFPDNSEVFSSSAVQLPVDDMAEASLEKGFGDALINTNRSISDLCRSASNEVGGGLLEGKGELNVKLQLAKYYDVLVILKYI